MEVETWDADFDLPTQNFNAFAQTSSNSGAGGAPPSISSRLSVHSENVSVAGGGDEDWNLMIDAEDEGKAVKLARETAGITLPSNVPASALLGGTIKRLGGAGAGAGGGRKTAAAAFAAGKREGEDWGEDIEMPDTGVLQLKGRMYSLRGRSRLVWASKRRNMTILMSWRGVWGSGLRDAMH